MEFLFKMNSNGWIKMRRSWPWLSLKLFKLNRLNISSVKKFLIIALPVQHFQKWVTGHVSKPALNYAHYPGTT